MVIKSSKMVKLKVSTYLATILFVLFLTLFLFANKQQKHNAEIIREISQGNVNQIEILTNLVFLNGQCISIPINKEMMVTDSKRKIIKITDLINKPTYIYHFDETNCELCVENFVPFISQLFKKLGNKRIIILGSFEKSENLFLRLKRFEELKEISAYNIISSNLKETEIGKINKPYIFELDSNFISKKVFIPEKELPYLSQIYCNNIIAIN